MKVNVEQVYTSVACNRTPEIADWNAEGIICYGANNAVVIYDTKIKGKDPLTVLSHHKSLVNSVKWLRRANGICTELISGSADKTAAIWTLQNEHWDITSPLIGHSDGVTCVHGVYNEDDLTVYTGSIDSTIKVWQRINGITTLKHTILLNSGLCLTLHCHLLPTTQKPILFCALDDHKIHIFAGDDYHRVHTLTGHEDWVRGLDVLDIDKSTIILASASQDTYIRLWRIQKYIYEAPSTGIRVEQKIFSAYDEPWSVKLDAVLAGHEGWVYGVQWQPNGIEDTNKTPNYRLLSSSLDKTLIIWEPESSPQRGEGEGAWVERVRVGEVGGNGLGFYGSRFGPDGKSFMGHGYNGSFHIWEYDKETNQWHPSVVCGGHFGAVEDIRWEPQHGRYLMSVSTDQTTRVHAPWNHNNGSEWHEIARPQVHGYDMASLALIDSTTFTTAAEEKVIRVFKAPHNFVLNFNNIIGQVIEENGKGPEGASVPSLGLSNKAVYIGVDEQTEADDENDGYFVPVHMTAPPTEETLMQNTLWPEVHKLYGHGYEVYTLDASPDGSLIASACKATTPEHAAILIWETSNWQQIQKLISHQLTVTQLAFSPDSRQLLSVSRDRRWTLFQRAQGTNSFEIISATDKTNGVHSRIIWCCAWSYDGGTFGTGSRDGKVCLWSKSAPKQTSLKEYGLLGTPLEINISVTALAFAPRRRDNNLLAVGLETGIIRLYQFEKEGWSMLKELNNNMAHHLTVRRLAFKPTQEERMMLASCGTDRFVRIYSLVNI